jgi:glycerol kinase
VSQLGEQYILTIDQGTSATKAILFNRKGQVVNRCDKSHKQYYPNPGWVEHDPEEIYKNTLQVIHEIFDKTSITGQHIVALAITNQRETVLVWEKQTGKPIYNAVVWHCNRASNICNRLLEQGYEKKVKEKTGLVLSAYFSAAKIKWILDNVEGAREKAEEGKLIYGTVDSWLVWKLTNGKSHVTDYSNASRTQLFNIKELNWDEELLQIFNIPQTMAPEIKYSDEIFGYTTINGILSKEIPITGIMGDSHAALFGQKCFKKGMAKATYGTGSSVMMNIGEKMLESRQGLVTSIAWGMDNQVEYVFEGNINCTGATIEWLVKDLELITNAKMSGKIASSIESTEGVYLVPAFVGLSAPYWNSEAKASIVGISRGTKKTHIVRAAEESIAYQIKDIVDLMSKESGVEVRDLRVDGGPTRDTFLMQFQANILGATLVCNRIEELSAMGSAFMAGLARSFWHSKEEIEELRTSSINFNCKMNSKKRNKLYHGWKEAVKRTLFSFN